MDGYEYLTGEDLGLKQNAVEQPKFEYSPLGKVFNKGLKEEDKKKGLFKRLKNIGGKNKKLLNTFSEANKVGKASKNKVINNNKKLYIIHSIVLENLKILMSLKNSHTNLCILNWKIFIKNLLT